MGAAGDGADVPQVVKARAFVVVDEDGAPAGIFASSGNGALMKCQAVRANTFEVSSRTDAQRPPIALLGNSDSDDSSAILELRSNGMASILEGGSDKVEVVKE